MWSVDPSYEPERQKAYHRTCTPSEDSDQRIFTGRILDSKDTKVSSCGQRRQNVQILSLRWVHARRYVSQAVALLCSLSFHSDET